MNQQIDEIPSISQQHTKRTDIANTNVYKELYWRTVQLRRITQNTPPLSKLSQGNAVYVSRVMLD